MDGEDSGMEGKKGWATPIRRGFGGILAIYSAKGRTLGERRPSRREFGTLFTPLLPPLTCIHELCSPEVALATSRGLLVVALPFEMPFAGEPAMMVIDPTLSQRQTWAYSESSSDLMRCID